MSYNELRATYPKAQKDYTCEWCAENISVGETHFSRVYCFNGEFMSGRMHLECESAMGSLKSSDLEDGWMAGDYPRGSRDPR